MVITVSIFYFLYLLVVLIFLLYSFFNIYHLARFGFFSLINILVIALYAVVASWYLLYSFSILLGIDWNLPLIDTSRLFDFGNIINIGLK